MIPTRRQSDFFCGSTNGGNLNGRGELLEALDCSARHLVIDQQSTLQLLTFTQTLPTLVRYILCQWEHVEWKSGGISLTILNLKLCLSPNTEKREGSRMTYWLPSVVMVMRVFSANKKDPLVSQEDTSPPPPTNPNPHKTKTANHSFFDLVKPREKLWSLSILYIITNKWNWRGLTKNINLEYFTISPENGWWCGSEWLGGKIR